MTPSVQDLKFRGGPYTLWEFCILLGDRRKVVSVVKTGYLKFTLEEGRYAFQEDEIDFALQNPRYLDIAINYFEREGRTLEGRPSSDFRAPLGEFLDYQRPLDQFCWLLKMEYADKESAKSGKFRLDELVKNYIVSNKITPKRIFKLLDSKDREYSDDDVRHSIDSLMKAWYNEMSYVYPNVRDRMNIDNVGITSNLHISSERMTFMSWKITQAYYTIYHVQRFLCDILLVQYDRKEHHAPIRAFKSTKLRPAQKCLIFFPFNLSVSPGQASFTPLSKEKPWMVYKYAKYPSDKNLSFSDVELEVQKWFLRRSKFWNQSRRRNEEYSMIDFLYDFRTWSNYISIDNFLDLRSKGYKSYLDMDLSIITFFYVMFAELTLIAMSENPSVACDIAKSFCTRFSNREESLAILGAYNPIDVRFQIYEKLGLLGDIKWDLARREDPNSIKI